MVAVESMRLARIRTIDGHVYIVQNPRDLAGGVKFDTAARSVRALNRPDFETRVRFLPWKRIASIEELGSS